ncbi:Putative anaphase-promoting complex, subunit CDC26 [Septoria linicola]|uniref:Anaphase-promoting complex, subunit CDC26 n=1 Tax=Septoria linicola TaxID=215465 RepID=A0A9Q9EL35_9PEZI|nr:Putative anaphase-promoting complex, subunit CDC26 [Septoria linicola]
MLSRPPSKLSLTVDDIAEYERRKAHRDALKQQEENEQSTGKIYGDAQDTTPAAQAKPKAKTTRDQRIGLGASRN